MPFIPTMADIAPYVRHKPLVDLMPYQRDVANFAIMNQYTGLFLSMGCGKTLVTLETIYELDPPCHVLIVGPKPVARSTWQAEIEKWHFPIRIKSLFMNEKGRPRSHAERLKLYGDVASMPPTVWFINQELVSDLVKNLPHVNGIPVWPFGMVILDEAQAFKSYTAKRFQDLAFVRPQIWRLMELTGTPTPTSPMDLWPLIYLLDQGQRLGPTITTYRSTWFTADKFVNNRPVSFVPRDGALEDIYRRIWDVTISVNAIAQKMPDVIMNDVPVSLTPEELAVYKEMVKEQVLAFKNGQMVDVKTIDEGAAQPTPDTASPTDAEVVDDDETHVATAANTAVLQAKLSQLASGAIYVDRTTKYIEVHREKIDATLSIIENTPGPVLVAYHFKSDLDMLLKYLHEANVDARKYDGSPEMVTSWNKGEIPVMLIQPASAGHGLNLQYGGSTLVWYTLPWSLEEYLQTNARLARQGQAQPVIIHHLLCERTIDGKILDALARKDLSQTELTDAIQLTIEDAESDESENQD